MVALPPVAYTAWDAPRCTWLCLSAVFRLFSIETFCWSVATEGGRPERPYATGVVVRLPLAYKATAPEAFAETEERNGEL